MRANDGAPLDGVDRPDSIRYRPEIDGLRAIAVLAVLAYHAFPRAVPGGFAGVDIFFVISGYLITGIIIRQSLEKRFSFANFYARRILRIFPCLVVVIFVTFVIAWFTFPAAEMEALGTSIRGAAAFIENLVLHEQIVGYFDPQAERLPLLHLWSLGIEEQYYIVWPVALLLISRWPARRMAIVGALALGSLFVCLLTPPIESAWAFYSPTTRAWELLAGSLVGLRLCNRPVEPARSVATALALAGLAGIAFTFCAFSAGSHWPDLRTAVPVLAATALIATANTVVHRRILSARSLVIIGRISYPLYLWHFPLIAFAKMNMNGAVPALLMSELLALSALLAWLTYRFIEQPIRFGAAAIRWKIAPLAVAMAATGLIGIAAVNTRGLPVRFPQPIRNLMLSGTETESHWRRAACLLMRQPASEFASECAGQGGRPLLLIWGDSYGAALYPGLLHFSAERGYDVAQYTASACPPLIGYSLSERPYCKSINDDVLSRIKRLRPDVVILDATWGQTETVLRQDLPRTVALLKAAHITNIVIMGPPPGWLGGGLSQNILYHYRETHQVLPVRTFHGSTDTWTRQRDAQLQELSHELGVRYISVRDIFCNESGCLSRIGPNDSELTAFDSGHLTVPGATFLAARTVDDILNAIAPPPQ
ncbi:acyltransferase [Bradyrhizobium macuxiense]|uniref:Acyltransferase n=1 Tax=Bradyrhizobium macuxiense TaxID=1755647 RepID=A0A120FN29_9BRAD|nr:acyltransferase [Bradyrhizobium macuxiense]